MTARTILKKGYFVRTESTLQLDSPCFADPSGDKAASDTFNHVFCGDNTTPGAECPNCSKPLLQILRLDMADQRLNGVATPSSTLPLLYCWRCNIVLDTFFYRLNADGTITVVEYAKGNDEGLGDDYPDAFPAAKAYLLALSDQAAEYIHQLNEDETFDDSGYPDEITALDRCEHQVGGEPYLVNGDSYGPITCPGCAKSMPLLASLGTDCTDPRGMLITEINHYVQVIYHYCEACGIVGALNEAD